jgi:succinate dehydrogenase/fumarate reductase flavoprotein subunit
MTALDETDVVVIGSGASGLSASISAVQAGAEVVVLEQTDKFGGTSAVSGGVPWIPNNHHMHEVGSSDSRDRALTYLRSLSRGGMDMELAETFLDEAPKVLRFLEEKTPLRFRAIRLPDYHFEFPGGNIGRSVSPMLFPANELGELRSALRSSPHWPIPLTMADADDGVDLLDPVVIGDRLAKGLVGTGQALVSGLLKAASDQGVGLRRNVRVRSLVVEDGRVVGVSAESGDGKVQIRARRGVVIATGGFEWNETLSTALLRGPVDGPASPPHNKGDGLLMAAEVGAVMSNTGEAWWTPTMRVPGEEYDGQPLNRLGTGELAKPGSIMVNRAGKRFVNEAHNYNDIGRVFHNFDAVAFDFPNLPAWMIFHHGFLDRYPLLTRYPGDPVPKWLHQAPTIRELAELIGVDADGLEESVERFNGFARDGRDPDFQRGESAFDLFVGDASREGAFRSLGPLDQPPFYAIPVRPGLLGTKGGPKINAKSEVLSANGSPIAGLYAAGNASGGFTGMAYPGAGATLGPALVFGHIAGREVASINARAGEAVGA